MTPGVVVELMNALERAGITLRDLQAITIPLVDQSTILRSDNDAMWMPVEQLTIDALIEAQTDADKLWRLTMDIIRSSGRTAFPMVLKAMPTLSHCVALWGFLAIKDLTDSYHGSIANSPLRSDSEMCRSVQRELDAYVSPHTDCFLSDLQGLRHTPLYPVLPKSETARTSLFELIAARITYCLSVNRPVFFLFTQEAPNSTIASLIQSAQGDVQ